MCSDRTISSTPSWPGPIRAKAGHVASSPHKARMCPYASGPRHALSQDGWVCYRANCWFTLGVSARLRENGIAMIGMGSAQGAERGTACGLNRAPKHVWGCDWQWSYCSSQSIIVHTCYQHATCDIPGDMPLWCHDACLRGQRNSAIGRGPGNVVGDFACVSEVKP